MNILWAALIVAAISTIAVLGMLAMRRRAPEGSYYSDSDRAAGVFGVLATGFSVLLGFLIFLAFESYDASRSGAETEAMLVAQQVETAQLLPTDVSAPLTGQLVCYARWVTEAEWDRMEEGSLGDDINPWGVAMFRTLEGVEPESASEEAAYGKWLDQTSDREVARQDRIHGAAGVMPVPLWIVLFFISAIVLVFLLGFADSGERATVQGLFMGSVVSVIVSMLLLLHFLDDPVQPGVGGLQPTAMERSLVLIDLALDVIGGDVAIPCDATGNPVQAMTEHAPRAQHDWGEIVATILLAFAAVATAWSSYQATRWNGEQTKAASRANALRIEAARADGLARTQTQIDVATFIEWVDATTTDEAELADFYLERFRPEFRPAFDAWLATDPLTDPDAPPSPFAMDEYQLEATAETLRLDAEAEAMSAAARRNIQRGANYVLGVVLFAVSLFFAGMSTKLRGTGPRTVLLVVGCLVFLGTAIWIATFPVSVSV